MRDVLFLLTTSRRDLSQGCLSPPPRQDLEIALSKSFIIIISFYKKKRHRIGQDPRRLLCCVRLRGFVHAAMAMAMAIAPVLRPQGRVELRESRACELGN